MALLIPLAIVLSMLVAYYAALDGHQIVVSRGVTVFLLLTTLLGWGAYAHEAMAQDQTLDNAVATMRGVVELALRQGVEVKKADTAVVEVLGKIGP